MTQPADNGNSLRLEFEVRFKKDRRGRRHSRECVHPGTATLPKEDLPRLTRLLALAHRWNRLIEDGVVANHAEIARMMGLSRARVTQIADLLYLAPDIQEEVLLRACGEKPELGPLERAMRPIIRLAEWNDQRRLWGNTVCSLTRTGGRITSIARSNAQLRSQDPIRSERSESAL